MKQLLIIVSISLCFFHSAFSQTNKAINKPSIHYPSYAGVVYQFFTNCSLRNLNYYHVSIIFIKNKDGYSVDILTYDTASKKNTANNIYPVWSAATQKFVDWDFPTAQPGENESQLKDYLDAVSALHYDCDPYYGYTNWFKDVIKDFKKQPVKTDSLIYGLSNAYFNYARHMVGLTGLTWAGDMVDTTAIPDKIDPDAYSKLMDTALYYDNLLNTKNPLFETAVGATPKNHYANDCMAAWLDLSYLNFSSYAPKFLAGKPLPYDAVHIAHAENFLTSCAPKAILFTNGDEDTYPLLYIQQKLHFRTDVTVVNSSLIGSLYYINYISNYVPIDIPPGIYSDDSYDYAYLAPTDTINAMAIDSFISTITNQYLNHTHTGLLIQSNKLYIKASPSAILADPSVDGWLKGLITPEIEIKLAGNYIMINNIITLDIIKNNAWKRPVEFANSDSKDVFTGLDKHFVSEGMVYRLFPENNIPDDCDSIGLFNTTVNYNLFINSLKLPRIDSANSLSGIDDEKMCESMVMIFSFAINYYKNAGQNDKANALFTKLITALPPQNLNYNIGYISLVRFYYMLNENDKARELAKNIVNKQIDYLKGLNNLDDAHKYMNINGAVYSANIIKYFEGVVMHCGDMGLALYINKELTEFYPH